MRRSCCCCWGGACIAHVQQRVRQHGREDDRYAHVKGGIELALLAEQHDREHDRVHGLEAQRELGAERARVLERAQRKREGHKCAPDREHDEKRGIARAWPRQIEPGLRQRSGDQRQPLKIGAGSISRRYWSSVSTD